MRGQRGVGANPQAAALERLAVWGRTWAPACKGFSGESEGDPGSGACEANGGHAHRQLLALVLKELRGGKGWRGGMGCLLSSSEAFLAALSPQPSPRVQRPLSCPAPTRGPAPPGFGPEMAMSSISAALRCWPHAGIPGSSQHLHDPQLGGPGTRAEPPSR